MARLHDLSKLTVEQLRGELEAHNSYIDAYSQPGLKLRPDEQMVLEWHKATVREIEDRLEELAIAKSKAKRNSIKGFTNAALGRRKKC